MMLNAQVYHSLFKLFPYKCEDFQFILENTNNIKELSATFEVLVNSIFGFETGLNLTQNEKYVIQWPLKSLNKFNNTIEFNSIFNFLSTDSLFWSIIFKLSNLQLNFKFSINNFPMYIRYRIENNLSILSSRLDTMNYLNLNALEYYLVCFISSILLHHDSNSSKLQNQRSSYFYDEFNGKMELNCLYSDLLENYLNFFLPINTRDVNFPQLINYSQTQLPPTRTTNSSKSPYSYQTAQPPRLLKTSFYDNDSDYQTEFIKQEDSTKYLIEQINSNFFHKNLDRTNDLQKIDFFMKLLVDLWICPFSDSLNEKYFNTQLLAQIDIIFEIKHIIKHIYSFSNANYNIGLSKLLDVSTTATSGDDINHMNRIQKVRFDTNNNDRSNLDGSYLNPSRNKVNTIYKTPIDDLRIKIVDIYLRKPMYKFLKYNIENWTLSSTIKFLIETWLLYIQPWCSPQSQEGMQYEQFMFDIHPSASIWSEFIKDNIFIYVDLYQLILRRFCLLDLTILSNVKLLYRICCVFSQGYLIDTIREIETNITTMNRRRLSSPIRQGGLLKTNFDRNQQQNNLIIINLFKEFNKQISNYKPLVGTDSNKISRKLIDILLQTKNLFIIDNQKRLLKKNENFFVKMIKAMFYDDNEQNQRLSHLNQKEIEILLNLIDECVNFMDKFHAIKPEEQLSFLNGSTNSDSFSKSLITSRQSIDENMNITPEYEPNEDGLTLKLSPRGQRQMLNLSCRTNIEKIYDPDTAPISEFECKPLVYFLRFITDYINFKFQNELQNFYNRTGVIGSISKQLLYGPNYFKNKVTLQQSNLSQVDLKTDRFRVRLSLRRLTDYRFIVYFLIIFFLIKFISGYSYFSNILLLIFLFCCYILIKAIIL